MNTTGTGSNDPRGPRCHRYSHRQRAGPRPRHTAPTVAERFVDRGDDVRFLTGSRFADRVRATGAAFVPLPPRPTSTTELLAGFSGARPAQGHQRGRVRRRARLCPARHGPVRRADGRAHHQVRRRRGEPVFLGAAFLLAHPARNGRVSRCAPYRRTAHREPATPPLRSGAATRAGVQSAAKCRAQPGEWSRPCSTPTGRSMIAPSAARYGSARRDDGLGTPGRRADPVHGARVRVPDLRRAAEPALRRARWKSGSAGAPGMVGGSGQRSADRPRHPGHRREHRLQPGHRAHPQAWPRTTCSSWSPPAAGPWTPCHRCPPTPAPPPTPLTNCSAGRVYVTNGGYGGVQYALCHGVPIVATGGKEDKPEVGARVAWSRGRPAIRSEQPSSRTMRRNHPRRPLPGRTTGPRASGSPPPSPAAPGFAGLAQIVDRLTQSPLLANGEKTEPRHANVPTAP